MVYYFFYLCIQSDSLVLQKNTSYRLPNPLATDRVNKLVSRETRKGGSLNLGIWCDPARVIHRQPTNIFEENSLPILLFSSCHFQVKFSTFLES